MIQSKWESLSFRWKIAISIVIISIAVMIPEISFGGGSGIVGYDSFFHISRYVDTAMQIKTGNFSYFQQWFTLNNAGKISNLAHSPVFAYFQGLLMLLSGFHGIIWYVLSCFFINVFAVSSMTYLALSNGVKLKYSNIISTFFIISGPVSQQLNSSTYIIEYAFFPILVSAAIRLLRDEKTPIKVWELVLSTTLLAQVHLFGVFFGALLYALALIAYVLKKPKTTILRSTLLKIFKSCILILILNFNVWGYYIEVSKSNTLVEAFTPGVMLNQESIDFNIFNGGTSIFLLIILVISSLVILGEYKKLLFYKKFFLILCIPFILISFGLINLNLIPIIKIFEFYFRFYIIPFPILLLFLAEELSKDKNKLLLLATSCSLVLTLFVFWGTTSLKAQSFITKQFNYPPLTPQQTFDAFTRPLLLTDRTFYNSLKNDYGILDIMSQYAPNDSPYKEGFDFGNTSDSPYSLGFDFARGEKSQAQLNKYFIEDIFHEKGFVGTDLKRNVTNSGLEIEFNSNKDQVTTIPVLIYRHTDIYLNGVKLSKSQVETTYSGALKVKAQKGLNTLKIAYSPSNWFVVGILIQFVVVLILMAKGIYSKFRRKI